MAAVKKPAYRTLSGDFIPVFFFIKQYPSRLGHWFLTSGIHFELCFKFRAGMFIVQYLPIPIKTCASGNPTSKSMTVSLTMTLHAKKWYFKIHSENCWTSFSLNMSVKQIFCLFSDVPVCYFVNRCIPGTILFSLFLCVSSFSYVFQSIPCLFVKTKGFSHLSIISYFH
jgi:hypothetical protein